MITTAHDLIWQRVVNEIPSRHFAPALRQSIFGCRQSLAEFAHGHAGKLQYLEVGCRLGHSLATVMLAAKDVEAVVVDMWIPGYGDEPNPGPLDVLAHLQALGVDRDKVQIFQGDSHMMLPAMRGQFDLILVDGDHTEEGAEADIRDCERLLAPGGLMVFDDAIPPLLEVWRRVSNELGLVSTERLGDYPWCEGRRRLS